jgi:hypothetical protein
MEFRRRELSDEVVTPHAEYGEPPKVVSARWPHRAYTSQKHGSRAAVCTQQQRRLEPIEFESAVSENAASRFRDRLHVHHTARDHAAPFEIGRRGRTVSCPIVEAAEECTSRRYEMIPVHLQYPTTTKATLRKGHRPEVTRR